MSMCEGNAQAEDSRIGTYFAQLSAAKQLAKEEEENSTSNVVTINLSKTHVGDAGIAYINAAIQQRQQQEKEESRHKHDTKTKKLLRLDLSGNEATSVEPLCELLRTGCEGTGLDLTSLDLSRNRLSHQATTNLVEALVAYGAKEEAKLPMELDISHCNAISATESWTRLFDTTQRVDTQGKEPTNKNSLRIVKLVCDDEPLVHVASVGPLLFSICRSVFLTHLSLNNCMLENEAIAMLAEGLCPSPTSSSDWDNRRYCANLRVLSLRKNRIACTGLAALSFALSGMQGPAETLVAPSGSGDAQHRHCRPVAPKHVARAMTQRRGHVPPLTALEVLDLSDNPMLGWIREENIPARQKKYRPARGDVLVATSGDEGMKAAVTKASKDLHPHAGATHEKPSIHSSLPDAAASRPKGRSDPSGLVQLGYALMFLRGLTELRLDGCDLGDGASDSPFFGCERGGVSELCDGARNTAAIGGGRLKVLSLARNGFNQSTETRLARISGFRAVFL